MKPAYLNLLRVWIALSLTFGGVHRVMAQAALAEISGSVSDPTGAVVPGATVRVIQQTTNLTTTLTTNQAGYYYARVNPGMYQIEVEARGFQHFLARDIPLTSAHTVTYDVKLALGTAAQKVEVTAQAGAAAMNREDATVGLNLPTRTISALPTQTRRLYEMLNVIPGTVFGQWGPARGFDLSLFQPFVSIGGSPSGRGNIWIVDGINVKDSRLNGDTGPQPDFNPPPEDVQEMHVLFNNYSAEFGDTGGGGGAAITVALKQGTNDFHGEIYEYNQNDVFDARNFFSSTKPVNRYNNFGGTLGGPIKKNKTFFFLNLQWMVQHRFGPEIDTAPTVLQRQGDFSQTFDSTGKLIPIYDPMTTCGISGNPACAADANGSPIYTRHQFPGNVIPQNRLDSVALNILSHYPLPNRAGTTTGANNFEAQSLYANNKNDVQVYKVDHQFNERNHAVFEWMNDFLLATPCGGFCSQPESKVADPTARQYWVDGEVGIAGLSTVLRPNLLNDLRFGFGNFTFDHHALGNVPGVFNGGWPQKLGLKNVAPTTFPSFALAGYTGIGAFGFAQQYFDSLWRQWTVQDYVNWVRGKHNLRFGGEFKPQRRINAFRQYPSGTASFDTRATAQPNVGGTGNGLASMLLGQVASSSIFDQIPYDEHTWFLGTFIQDNWHVGRNLTLNLGLRWEYDRPTWDATNGFNFFNFTKINPVCNCPGVIEFARNKWLATGEPVDFYPPMYTHFQPRLGVAWSPGGHSAWVIRGGYGVFDPGQDQGTTMWQTPELGNTPVSQNLTTDALGLTPAFILSQGFPPYTAPPLDDAYGAVPIGQSPILNPNFYAHIGRQYMQMANFNIQRQIGTNMKVEVGWLGNFVRNLPQGGTAINYNEVPPDKRGPGNAQLVRPFPQFGTLSGFGETYGRSNYNGFYALVARSWGNGLEFQSNFTHSKLLATTYYRSNYLRQQDYGPSGYDIENRFIWSGVYELPFGPGRRYLGTGLAGKLIGGWRVGGELTLQSGDPLNFGSIVNTCNCFNGGTQGINLLRHPSITSNFDPAKNTWFDASAFAFPAPYTFGNAGIGIIRGPRYADFDTSFTKRFTVTERYRVEVRLDFFDTFNHPNFADPNTTFGSAAFGSITSTVGYGGNRFGQLSAKVIF